MKISLIVKCLLLATLSGLVACGGSDKKGGNNTSSAAASSSAASSSVMSNVMEVGKEYPYTANTKITNTGSTDLVVTQKYYWETQETKVVLVEGSATID